MAKGRKKRNRVGNRKCNTTLDKFYLFIFKMMCYVFGGSKLTSDFDIVRLTERDLRK